MMILSEVLLFIFIFVACRLWFGAGQVCADKNLLQRGGHLVVPSTRRPPRLHGVLDANRHVVRYFSRKTHNCLLYLLVNIFYNDLMIRLLEINVTREIKKFNKYATKPRYDKLKKALGN